MLGHVKKERNVMLGMDSTGLRKHESYASLEQYGLEEMSDVTCVLRIHTTPNKDERNEPSAQMDTEQVEDILGVRYVIQENF